MSSLSAPVINKPFDFRIRKKVVAVGDGAAGKTSLLWKIRFGEIPKGHTPTIMENSVINTESKVPSSFHGKVKHQAHKDKVKLELALWDTAGQDEYDRLRALSYPNTDVVLLVCAVNNPDSLINIKNKWSKELVHYCRGVPVILVANKVDLLEDDAALHKLKELGQQMVTQEDVMKLARDINADKTFLVSALTGHNVRELFDYTAYISIQKRKHTERPCPLL